MILTGAVTTELRTRVRRFQLQDRVVAQILASRGYLARASTAAEAQRPVPNVEARVPYCPLPFAEPVPFRFDVRWTCESRALHHLLRLAASNKQLLPLFRQE